jgi:hypothetical protein
MGPREPPGLVTQAERCALGPSVCVTGGAAHLRTGVGRNDVCAAIARVLAAAALVKGRLIWADPRCSVAVDVKAASQAIGATAAPNGEKGENGCHASHLLASHASRLCGHGWAEKLRKPPLQSTSIRIAGSKRQVLALERAAAAGATGGEGG